MNSHKEVAFYVEPQSGHCAITFYTDNTCHLHRNNDSYLNNTYSWFTEGPYTFIRQHEHTHRLDDHFYKSYRRWFDFALIEKFLLESTDE